MSFLENKKIEKDSREEIVKMLFLIVLLGENDDDFDELNKAIDLDQFASFTKENQWEAIKRCGSFNSDFRLKIYIYYIKKFSNLQRNHLEKYLSTQQKKERDLNFTYSILFQMENIKQEEDLTFYFKVQEVLDLNNELYSLKEYFKKKEDSLDFLDFIEDIPFFDFIYKFYEMLEFIGDKTLFQKFLNFLNLNNDGNYPNVSFENNKERIESFLNLFKEISNLNISQEEKLLFFNNFFTLNNVLFEFNHVLSHVDKYLQNTTDLTLKYYKIKNLSFVFKSLENNFNADNICSEKGKIAETRFRLTEIKTENLKIWESLANLQDIDILNHLIDFFRETKANESNIENKYFKKLKETTELNNKKKLENQDETHLLSEKGISKKGKVCIFGAIVIMEAISISVACTAKKKKH